MKARNITFKTRRESYNRQYDRITIDMVHEGFGFSYRIVIDHKGFHVEVLPDASPKKLLPVSSPLEQQHAQEAKARALYSLHHWAQHLRDQHSAVIAYMKGGEVSCDNPMLAVSRNDIDDKELHSISVCIWVLVNPMLLSKTVGDRISFQGRMRLVAKVYGLKDAIDGIRRGYKVSDNKRHLINAYCDALKFDKVELKEWLSRDID